MRAALALTSGAHSRVMRSAGDDIESPAATAAAPLADGAPEALC